MLFLKAIIILTVENGNIMPFALVSFSSED